MDQSEPEIRHLELKRVLHCAEDPDTGVRFIDLQTERGLIRLHCDDDAWHELLRRLEEFDAQEISAAADRMNVPSILRFLNTTQKSPTA
ncbi:MAG TPA: hypothetical protein VJM53_07675 [Burkholderiales bacterium]|jgi:hypothetical protein|nr:hypothetical protein [Burkholderiales bacterium]